MSPAEWTICCLNLSQMTINDGDERMSCPLKAENYEISRRVNIGRQTRSATTTKRQLAMGKCSTIWEDFHIFRVYFLCIQRSQLGCWIYSSWNRALFRWSRSTSSDWNVSFMKNIVAGRRSWWWKAEKGNFFNLSVASSSFLIPEKLRVNSLNFVEISVTTLTLL